MINCLILCIEYKSFNLLSRLSNLQHSVIINSIFTQIKGKNYKSS